MASSSEGKAPAAEADSSSSSKDEEQKSKAATAPAMSADAEEEKQPAASATKKTKTRRFTKQQIRCCIAAGEPDLPLEGGSLMMELFTKDFMAKLPQEFLDTMAKIDAEREERIASMVALQEGLRKERQDILDQYYAEYEVDTDDEEEARPAPPRPGRRRFRQGLVKRGGRTRKLN